MNATFISATVAAAKQQQRSVWCDTPSSRARAARVTALTGDSNGAACRACRIVTPA